MGSSAISATASTNNGFYHFDVQKNCFNSTVHGANMGPTWVLSAPDGPHVGPMDLVIWVPIYPKVFDCSFEPYDVKYIHNGSPLRHQDHVKLLVHQFHMNQSSQHIQELTINIANARYEIFIQDTRLRPLEVEGFFGLSNLIDTSVLRFSYNYYDRAICTVSFNKWGSVYPMYGEIVMGETEERVESISHDCRDFLYLGLRYKHLRPPTPDLDYLPLAVEVSDPSRGEAPFREHMYLPIKLKGAYPNMPPTGSFISTNVMAVDEFTMATLDPEQLMAKDSETPDELLIFNITKQPGYEEGYFVHLEDPTRPIFSFVQSELMHHNIGYRPPNVSRNEAYTLHVEFVIFDSQFAESEPVSLHITVMPSVTTGPRVADNMGLTLIEGHTQVISADNLHIMDTDNLDEVRAYVKGGLRHGRLEVDGKDSVMFSVDDLEMGRVTYTHDDSDTTEDKLLLRISDHQDSMRIKFPIHILPLDDSAPYLVNNVAMHIGAGGYLQITTDLLSAHDKDSEDEHILYMIKVQPTAGEIIRKYRPMISGHRATRFTQQELKDGLIYYHHMDMSRHADSFEFRLVDNNDPPNKSGKYGVTITIMEVEDNPPRLVAGSSRQLMVNETDIVFITKDILRYTDNESPDEELTYTITNQPFFLTTTVTVDAGRIISVPKTNHTVLAKDANYATIHTFQQRDINEGYIAYMPPMDDIGPIRRHARFMFTVSDKAGNKVMDQPFDITLLPVNNQVPHMTVRRLSIIEGGTMRISASDISAYDPDTDQNRLQFILENGPQYGRILKQEEEMQPGDHFTLTDLLRPNIRYVHDGSDIQRDGFTLSVTDGINKVSNIVVIDVKLVNDHNPEPLKNLQSTIQVLEGGSTYITSANIAATDNDTDDQMLNFVAISTPQYGEIQVRGRKANQFSQADIWNNYVKYIHASGEIGMEAVYDFASFAVTDEVLSGIADSPLLDLNVTILPVDNQAPYVVLGSPLFVEEGKSATITEEVLSGQDVDTPGKYLRYYVTMQPGWGFLQNTGPEAMRKNPGHPILSFTLQDIQLGHVSYRQAEHQEVEPLSDAFEVYVTDGQVNSNPSLVQVSVLPSRDEPPHLDLTDFQVEEGGEVLIRADDITVSDADLPPDELIISIASQPMHGKISLKVPNSDLSGWVEVADSNIKYRDIMDNKVQLIYHHDGSHNLQDKFTLQVSDGEHSAKCTGLVTIQALNDGYGQYHSNSARLQVNYGQSALITPDELYTANTANDQSSVYFFLTSSPRFGVLQVKEVTTTPDGSDVWLDLREGKNFTQSNVDSGRIRYLHLGGSEEAGMDLFNFFVTDGISIGPTESFEIEILGDTGKDLFLVVKHIDINEGDTQVITQDILSATDTSSKPQDLSFKVTTPPSYGNIAMITTKNVPITHFTQMDIDSEKIVYTHTSKADATEDMFHFTVINSLNHSRSGVFKINIEPFDKSLPTLAANVPLTVVQGSEAHLSPSNLLITDPDTDPHNLTYHIIEAPQHGLLIKSGQEGIDSFSQHDVDAGHVSYVSDYEHDAGMDFFLFIVSDSHHEGYLINGTLESRSAFFNVLIQPLSKEPPSLVINQKPDMLQSLGNGNYGFILSNKHLMATHPLGDNPKIVYTLLVKPQFGYLENLETGRIVKKRFRQRDLDESRIAYVLDGASYSSNDSFTFRVQDVKRNTLDNQRFDMQWSVVEFAEPKYIVCEDAERLSIVVTRRGALSHTANVDIKYKGMSAKANQDFIPSDVELIQFEPGMSRYVWDVEIINDGIDEGNEKFRALLRTPTNAILGERDRTNVQIVNLKNGKCADYIGMISKASPEAFPTLPTVEPELEEVSILREEPLTSFELLDEDTDIFDFGIDRDDEFGLDGREGEFDDIFAINYKGWPDEEEEEEEEELPEEIEGIDEEEEEYVDTNLDIFGAPVEEDDDDDDDDDDDMFGFEGEDSEESRDGKKNRRRNGRRKKKGRKKGRQNERTTTVTPMAEEAVTDSLFGLNPPQPCTEETDGLLYFDIHSSRMFRCQRGSWDTWQPSEVQARMFNIPRGLSAKIAPETTTTTTTTTTTPAPVDDWATEGERAVERDREREYEWQQELEFPGDVPYSYGKEVGVERPRHAEQRQENVDCQRGWEKHRGNCYRAFEDLLPWDRAERRCRDFGGHLTDVESIKHLQWLRKIVQGGSFWIGLNDLRLHQVWEYTSGGPVRFYHWRKGFPRSQLSLAKHCVLVAAKLEWVNRPCDNRSARFICSKPLHDPWAPYQTPAHQTDATKARRRRWRRRRTRDYHSREARYVY